MRKTIVKRINKPLHTVINKYPLELSNFPSYIINTKEVVFLQLIGSSARSEMITSE